MLTKEQEACNSETRKHILRVIEIAHVFACELMRQAASHDKSKLESPEVEIFTEFTPKLAAAKYPSEDYESFLKEMSVALDHHYANNRHHPQHFKNGVEDMNLLDVMLMLIDWKASSERQNDGNIRKSIEHNAKRFNINPQLVKIFENTADMLFNGG